MKRCNTLEAIDKCYILHEEFKVNAFSSSNHTKHAARDTWKQTL